MPSSINPMRGPGGARYPGTFMLALREALDQLGWQIVAWKGDHVDCVNAAGTSQQVGLENLYRRLRREPRGEWPHLIAELLGGIPAHHAEPPAHLSEVADRLLVRLSPPIKADSPNIWSFPVVDQQIVATLVIDYPTSMSYVTAEMVAESGESGEAWLRRGLANLLARSTAEQLPIIHPESGLMQGHFADAYDSSRALLLDELLPGYAEFGFYVAVPSRDHLLVLPISVESAPLAPWLRAIAGKTYGDMPYAISPELYWVHAGVWRPIAIAIEGEEVVIRPPAEFVAMIERLRSNHRADSSQNDSESLPN